MKQTPVLKPNLLLAKSYYPGNWKGSYSLVGHTADVVNAVSTLVDVLGDRVIEQFGLQYSLSELGATASLAAYIHDWGKANNHFQGVVRTKIKDAHPKRFLPHEPQIIRHEVASVLLAWEFKEWLQQGEGDFLIALAAAGGHHLKLGGKGGKCTDELGEIRQKNVMGFGVVVENLNDKDSLKLQCNGLGGRKHFGCGWFYPYSEVA